MSRLPSLLRVIACGSLLAFVASCGESIPSGPGGPGPGPAPDASNAKLSALAVSAGALSPAFDPDVTSYSVSVANSVTGLTVTPSVDSGTPAITVEGPGLATGGVPVAAGAASPSLSLAVGANVITVSAESEDGTASASYDITVTRAGGASRTCPTVDRGDPTDGVTTITVVQAPAPCNDGPLWAGWYCTVLRSTANNNGVTYTVEARWNRVGQNVRGSFSWVTGNDSSTHWREGNNLSDSVQDQLDTVDQVRSIDLAWGGIGTATVPRNGYVNLSSVYADVVEHLVATGVATGVLGHFGNSGGSMMGSNALANHRMHEVWDGMVVGGGPFWIDLVASCRAGSNAPHSLIDDWNWREVDGSTPCAQGSGADPSFACMSVLGPDSVLDYPNTIVAIVTGDSERAFIAGQAQLFFDSITARSKSHDVPTAPHNVLKTQSGANTVIQRIREIVDAGSIR